jgi:predicted RNA-binding Zn ribbon-like protein
METVLFDDSGGDLSLNFLNTVNWRDSGNSEDLFNTYADFLSWSSEAGTLTEAQREQLARQAGGSPEQAAIALRTLREARGALYRLLIVLVAGGHPGADLLEPFNRFLSRALAHQQIEFAPPTARWVFQTAPLSLEYPLWPILLAAANLLTTQDLDRVHTCASPTCGWVFIDRSRNGSRKWCSSTVCGNRERVRHYYSRKR